MSSWLSLRKKKSEENSKFESEIKLSQTKPFKFARLAVFSSLLLVDTLSPFSAYSEIQKAKDFKNQTSNIVRAEVMGKSGGMAQAQKKKVGEEEIKEKINKIKNLMIDFSNNPTLDKYHKLNNERGDNKYLYSIAYKQLTKEQQKKAFDAAWKNCEKLDGFLGKNANIKQAIDTTLEYGVGTKTNVNLNNQQLKFLKSPSMFDILKNSYPNLTFTILEQESLLSIQYQIIDDNAAKSIKAKQNEAFNPILDWFKKIGFTGITVDAAGAGYEGGASSDWFIQASGPNKSLSVQIKAIVKDGKVQSWEVINWNYAGKEKSESLRIEFQNLLNDATDNLNSFFYTIYTKKMDFLIYFNTQTDRYDTFYGIKEFDEKGNHIGYTSYRIEGDPNRLLIEAQRIMYERTYAIPETQRVRYYWMMNYIKPTLDTARYGITSQFSSLIASGEAYKGGRLIVKIGDNNYIYDGRGSIELPNGDKLYFSDIQIKRTETGIIKYITAIQYTANGDPIRTVDLPIYTPTDFVYDVKTGSTVKITLEPSKELLENVDYNRFSYTIKLDNNVVGYVKPPTKEKKSTEKVKEKAVKITTQVDGVPIQIQLLDVTDNAIFNRSEPDLYATIIVKNLNTNEEVTLKLKLDQVFNLKLGDKTIPIKIESPQWEFLTMTYSERVEQSVIVRRDKLKDDGASQVTITVTGTTEISDVSVLGVTLPTGIIGKLFGRTKIIGQYGYLEINKNVAPVKSIEPTAYNLIVENERTGEGFGLIAINGDPYLSNGIYNSAEDLEEIFIKKKIPIFGDYFGGTGVFYYKQVGKEIREGKDKATIMKDLEAYAGTAYIDLPAIISGEIGTKYIKIYKEMLDSQYNTKGKEYSIFYEASDWNKPGLYILRLDYRRKILGQGQEVPYLDNINLYMTLGWTITKIPSSLNPWDVFNRVRISWDHTEIQNEKRVPFTFIKDGEEIKGIDEINEYIKRNVIRIRMEGNRLYFELYGGNEVIESQIDSQGVKEVQEKVSWIRGIMVHYSKLVGANKEIGIDLNANQSITNNMQNNASSKHKYTSLSLEPYYTIEDEKGNKLRISLLYNLNLNLIKTESQQRFAEQKRGFTVSGGNWNVYVNYVSNNSSFFEKGRQKLFEIGGKYGSRDNIYFNGYYRNGIDGWGFNVSITKYFGGGGNKEI